MLFVLVKEDRVISFALTCIHFNFKYILLLFLIFIKLNTQINFKFSLSSFITLPNLLTPKFRPSHSDPFLGFFCQSQKCINKLYFLIFRIYISNHRSFQQSLLKNTLIIDLRSLVWDLRLLLLRRSLSSRPEKCVDECMAKNNSNDDSGDLFKLFFF